MDSLQNLDGSWLSLSELAGKQILLVLGNETPYDISCFLGKFLGDIYETGCEKGDYIVIDCRQVDKFEVNGGFLGICIGALNRGYHVFFISQSSGLVRVLNVLKHNNRFLVFKDFKELNSVLPKPTHAITVKMSSADNPFEWLKEISPADKNSPDVGISLVEEVVKGLDSAIITLKKRLAEVKSEIDRFVLVRDKLVAKHKEMQDKQDEFYKILSHAKELLGG